MILAERIGKVLDSFPKSHNEIFIAFVATLSGTMFGFDVSSMSAFISHAPYREFFNYPNSTQQGAITGCVSAGCFIGSICSNFISEPLGRRICLVLCSILWVLGAIVQSTCRNVAQLAVGRVISGTAIGIGSVVTPTYISEISRAKLRGMLGGLYQLAITFGILVMFYIGYGCTFIEGTNSFRAAWALQMLPGLCLFFTIPFLPESPRWLANHDQWQKAEDIIRKVNKKEPEHQVHIELAEIQESVMLHKTSRHMSYMTIFAKENWRSSVVAISAQMWNQLSGLNVMMYYIVYIFEMIGYEGNTVLVSSSIQYVIFFGVTVLSLPLPEWIGRRRLMTFGGVSMMVCLFINGSLFAKYSEPIPNVGPNDTVVIKIPPNHKDVGKTICAFSYLFVSCFASTWAVTSWAYFAEVLPNRTRSKAGSVAVASDWAINFAIAMFTPPAFRNISWKTFFLFGTFCGAMSIHCYLQYPETRRRTLEEIDMIFQSGVPAWKTDKYEIPYNAERGIAPVGEKDSVEHMETVEV